jgi:hypothetical protein
MPKKAYIPIRLFVKWRGRGGSSNISQWPDPGGRLGAELVVSAGWQEVAGGGRSNISQWPNPGGRPHAEFSELAIFSIQSIQATVAEIIIFI